MGEAVAQASRTLAEQVNAWRIIPRIALLFYLYACWDAFEWFKTLDDATTQQTSFVTGLWGAAAAWFGFYLNSGPGGRKDK